MPIPGLLYWQYSEVNRNTVLGQVFVMSGNYVSDVLGLTVTVLKGTDAFSQKSLFSTMTEKSRIFEKRDFEKSHSKRHSF